MHPRAEGYVLEGLHTHRGDAVAPCPACLSHPGLCDMCFHPPRAQANATLMGCTPPSSNATAPPGTAGFLWWPIALAVGIALLGFGGYFAVAMRRRRRRAAATTEEEDAGRRQQSTISQQNEAYGVQNEVFGAHEEEEEEEEDYFGGLGGGSHLPMPPAEWRATPTRGADRDASGSFRGHSHLPMPPPSIQGEESPSIWIEMDDEQEGEPPLQTKLVTPRTTGRASPAAGRSSREGAAYGNRQRWV